jgi:hypothetical protein
MPLLSVSSFEEMRVQKEQCVQILFLRGGCYLLPYGKVDE